MFTKNVLVYIDDEQNNSASLKSDPQVQIFNTTQHLPYLPDFQNNDENQGLNITSYNGFLDVNPEENTYTIFFIRTPFLIETINQIHDRYAYSNKPLVFVLSTDCKIYRRLAFQFLNPYEILNRIENLENDVPNNVLSVPNIAKQGKPISTNKSGVSEFVKEGRKLMVKTAVNALRNNSGLVRQFIPNVSLIGVYKVTPNPEPYEPPCHLKDLDESIHRVSNLSLYTELLPFVRKNGVESNYGIFKGYPLDIEKFYSPYEIIGCPDMMDILDEKKYNVVICKLTPEYKDDSISLKKVGFRQLRTFSVPIVKNTTNKYYFLNIDYPKLQPIHLRPTEENPFDGKKVLQFLLVVYLFTNPNEIVRFGKAMSFYGLCTENLDSTEEEEHEKNDLLLENLKVAYEGHYLPYFYEEGLKYLIEENSLENMETVFDTMSQKLNKILPEVRKNKIDLERFQTKFSYQPFFSGL